jgi:hypothetical protein
VFLLVGRLAVGGAPVVFWASDPVRPGEAVIVVGHDFCAKPKLEIARLADGEPGGTKAPPAWADGGQNVEVVQTSDQSLKFVVPSDMKPGVFAFRITTADGAVVQTLNRPQIWWAQADFGTSASAGGWIRVFGKSLA